MNDLEQSIRYVATIAGRVRWNLPSWDGTDIHIKRVEQIDATSWRAYYDEPDTGTEEDMLVERVGDTLEASYTDDVLAQLPLKIPCSHCGTPTDPGYLVSGLCVDCRK